MQYSIIEVGGRDLVDMTTKMVNAVNEYFENGWETHGDLKFISVNNNYFYHLLQPMIKRST